MRFDIVIGGDWRLEGGIVAGVEHELRALLGAGFQIGLLQLDTHLSSSRRPIPKSLERKIGPGQATLISGSQGSIQTRLLCLHHPAVLASNRQLLQRIKPERALIIVHRPPCDGAGGLVYDIHALHREGEALYPAKVFWAPVSGVCRSNLSRVSRNVPILEQNWQPFIFAEEWQTKRMKPLGAVPVIGRHGRPSWDKWPDNREELLALYPASNEVVVRFLGVGDRPQQLLDWRVPDNWTVLEWDETSPIAFVKSIDFFVYFHHSSWIEAFGRTVLEAIASGAVAIVPKYLRESFGDAAIYCTPFEAMTQVRRLHADWSAYLAQSRLGQQIARSEFGPANFLKSVRSIIGQEGGSIVGSRRTANSRRKGLHKEEAVEGRIAKKRKMAKSQIVEAKAKPIVADQQEKTKAQTSQRATSVSPPFQQFDIVYCGDFDADNECLAWISEELSIASEGGYRCAVIKHCSRRSVQKLPLSLKTLVDSGQVTMIADLSVWTNCQLAIFVPPAKWQVTEAVTLLRIAAGRVIAIPAHAGDIDAGNIHSSLCEIFGDRVTWAARTAFDRALLEARVPVERSLWGPSVRTPNSDRPNHPARLRVGMIASRNRSKEQEIPSFGAGIDVLVYGEADINEIATLAHTNDWEWYDPKRLSLGKFIEKIDFLLPYPGAGDVSMTGIAMAMMRGVSVLLYPDWRGHAGRGPIYVEPKRIGQAVKELSADENRLRALRLETAASGVQLFGPQHHRRRLGEYVHSVPPTVFVPGQVSESVRFLMLSSNGTGLGHVSRLLAISRRLSREIDPIFATMAHAVELIQKFDYTAEYLPSLIYTGAADDDWNAWFAEEMDRLIRFYDAKLVVFDGNHPPAGLLEGVGAMPDVKLAWVRRAMWKQADSPLVSLQRYFDLVIEPGEIAEEVDRGATVSARAAAVQVPPIRLLDQSDLLPRKAAAKALGLDAERPAVLIQLGSGSNRDIVTLTDKLVERLAKIPGLQIAIAEWAIGRNYLEHWKGTTLMRGFPISQYFNAFDFTISAAGYNTFNDVISFAIPTVFIPNDHPSMDNQSGRAAFAEKHGAAITLNPANIDEIVGIVPLLLSEKSRDFIKSNCQRIARSNGATTAAESLERLMGRMAAHG